MDWIRVYELANDPSVNATPEGKPTISVGPNGRDTLIASPTDIHDEDATVASGIYLYRLSSAQEVQVRRLLLLK